MCEKKVVVMDACWNCETVINPGNIYIEVAVRVFNKEGDEITITLLRRCCVRCAVSLGITDAKSILSNTFGGELTEF